MHYIDQFVRDIYTLLTNHLIINRGHMLLFYLGLCVKNIIGKLFGIKYTQQKFGDWTIHFDSFGAFFAIFTELFIYTIYHFKTEEKKPCIVDCGANIGMAVLYFKYLYPSARIDAYEPDKETFALLEKNITSNNLTDVVCWNEAVAGEAGELEFYSFWDMEWGPGNTLERSQVNFTNINTYKVPAVTLSQKGYQTIDFLKIDIEWSEGKVLKEMQASNLLAQVKRLSLEYHYDEEIISNKFASVIWLLEEQKFHIIVNINTLVTFSISEADFERLNKKYVLMLNCYR
jgi:FkbM family methyltransferase